MASSVLANRVKVATATTGTGTVTLGAAASNAFCTFAEAGIADGQTVTYCIEEGNDFEIGRGVYTASGTTMTRATVLLSKIGGTAGTSKMNLTGAATVRIVAAKEDLDVNDFTEDTSPDGTADFLWSHDASATLKKKVKPQNLRQSGGRQLLATGSVSNAATCDIVLTSYTAYKYLEIHLREIVPATDDVGLFMRFSTDGGSTYDAGASNYFYVNQTLNSSGTAVNVNSAAATELQIGSGTAANRFSSDAGASGSVIVKLLNRLSTSLKTVAMWQAAYISTTPTHTQCTGSGHRATAQDTDAVRFLMSSGNITASYEVYGSNN